MTYFILVYIFQVACRLHQRANKEEKYKYDFINLASRVEEFISRCLDALNDREYLRETILRSDEMEVLVTIAIKFERRKVILQNRVICSAISYLSMAIY